MNNSVLIWELVKKERKRRAEEYARARVEYASLCAGDVERRKVEGELGDSISSMQMSLAISNAKKTIERTQALKEQIDQALDWYVVTLLDAAAAAEKP